MIKDAAFLYLERKKKKKFEKPASFLFLMVFLLKVFFSVKVRSVSPKLHLNRGLLCFM